MRRLMLLVLLLLAGCTWGLGEYRAWDAVAREVNARDSHELAVQIEKAAEQAPQEVKDAVAPLVEKAKEIAVDEAQRAKIAQKDQEKYLPKEPVVPRSPEDDNAVQEGAGLIGAKNVRERKLAELPGRMVRGAAKVAVGVLNELTPAPVKWALKWAFYVIAGYAVLATLVSITVWLSRRFWRKSTKEAIERFDRLPEDQRKQLTASAHYLGLAFKKERK